MNMQQTTLFPHRQHHLMAVAQRPDCVMVGGDGHYLYDSADNAYLDFIQGWAVNCLGHNPPAMREALLQQADKLINAGPAFVNQPMLDLAGLLCRNSVFDEVFFANSGAEAVEGAIKLARRWGADYKGGAFGIITFNRAFHGRTLAAMSACGKPAFDALFEPKVSGFVRVPYNDLAATAEAITPDTAAIMLELVQGEAGVHPAEVEFVRGLERLCRQHNLLLIVDEVQTGIGRTGHAFGYQHYGITPDIMTLGKGLGGGVPITALLARHEVSCFHHGDQGGTYNGNPLMCALALAVVQEVLREEFLANVNTVGAYLRQQLELLSARYGLGEVRGRGLLVALDSGPLYAPEVMNAAHHRGLLINAPNDNTLRFMPALTVTAVEVDRMIAILGEVLAVLCQSEGGGNE